MTFTCPKCGKTFEVPKAKTLKKDFIGVYCDGPRIDERHTLEKTVPTDD